MLKSIVSCVSLRLSRSSSLSAKSTISITSTRLFMCAGSSLSTMSSRNAILESAKSKVIGKVYPTRCISLSSKYYAGKDELADEEAEVSVAEEQKEAGIHPAAGASEPTRKSDKDRTAIIPVETSIRYLKSDAYKQTYGGNDVWVLYRRNFRGQFAPRMTRKTCIRGGMLQTGNPCPICRDEYLILDYRNVDLLKQFISPYNGEILSYTKTGLCQKRHGELLVAILKAKDYGTITFDVPFREYDYSEYEDLYRSYRES